MWNIEFFVYSLSMQEEVSALISHYESQPELLRALLAKLREIQTDSLRQEAFEMLHGLTMKQAINTGARPKNSVYMVIFTLFFMVKVRIYMEEGLT